MRYFVGGLLCVACGCSTAPIAGLMDCVRPSRSRIEEPRRERPDEPRGDLEMPRLPNARPEDPFLQPPRLP